MWKITEVRFLTVGKKGKKYGKGENEHKSGSFEVKLQVFTFFFPDTYCGESAERWERMDTDSQRVLQYSVQKLMRT